MSIKFGLNSSKNESNKVVFEKLIKTNDVIAYDFTPNENCSN